MRSDPCCLWEFKSIFWPLKGARLKTRDRAKIALPSCAQQTSSWSASFSETGDRSGVRLGASYSADLEVNEGFFLLLLLPSMGQDLGELQLDCLRMMLFLRIRLFHFSDQHETWAVPTGALCIAASELPLTGRPTDTAHYGPLSRCAYTHMRADCLVTEAKHT